MTKPNDLLRPVRWRLVAAVTLQAVAALAGVVPFVAVVEIGRRLLAGQAGQIWPLVWLGVGALVLRLVLSTVAGLVSHHADNDLTLSLRRRLVAQVGRLPLGWFDRNGSGRVRSTVGDDVAALHSMVAHAWPDLVAAIVGAVSAFGYLVYVDWRLALVSLVPVLAGRLGRRLIIRSVTDHQVRYTEALAEASTAATELVQGISVVKTFGAANSRFTTATDGVADAFDALSKPMTRAVAITKASISPATVSLFMIAAGIGSLALGWSTPVGVLAAVLVGVGLTEQLGSINYASGEYRRARAAASRVAELLDTPAMPGPRAIVAPVGHRVEFDDVRFAYPGKPESEVLRGVRAELAPGTVTALVGPSGAGKSTMALLLPRFFDVTGGAVRIGGVDVRDIESRELYLLVGLILQDVRLLRASVRDNIRLGRPDASDADVVAAARAAQIHERITALPDGYDTMLGAGTTLSGGERQRLSIARALLADTPVLVLDEATAFADPESEAAVQDALSELARGRTVLVIAHRLATVTNADQILVLVDGAITEHGTHTELLAAGGRYAAMWAAQQGVAVG
ncbi:MAG TPA: ABC transporter ATP-binding protein [Micromonosporaceae bacterium]